MTLAATSHRASGLQVRLTSSPPGACDPIHESEAAAVRGRRESVRSTPRLRRAAGWLEDGATPIEQKAEPVGGVGLLDVQPQDHILEIGFGPGLAIRELARRATDGFVLGIDHSEVMVRRAAIRNRAAIEQGRVRLAIRIRHGPR